MFFTDIKKICCFFAENITFEKSKMTAEMVDLL